MRGVGRRFLGACLLILLLVAACTAHAGQAIQPAEAPELTPAQKEADFRYLTRLVRDLYPYAEINVREKGLDDILRLEPEYIARAAASPDNAAYFGVFREYLERLHQTGHAYYVADPEAQNYVRGESQYMNEVSLQAVARAGYWSGLAPQAYAGLYAHAALPIVYRDGAYTLREGCTLQERFLPAGTRIERVDGLSPDDWVRAQQDRVFLSFDAVHGKLYLPGLFATDPGRERAGWDVRFRLPDGSAYTAPVPKLAGPRAGDPGSLDCSTVYCEELAADVGYIRVRSFRLSAVQPAGAAIEEFMQRSAGRYKKLIIDIRGNGGGDPAYWMDYLVAPLIRRPLSYTLTSGLRRGLLDRLGLKFLVCRARGLALLGRRFHVVDFREIDPDQAGLDGAQWRAFRVTREIKPQQSFPFTGQAYLLVDDGCFSAAEDLATAVKRTGVARIVGTRTGGGAAAVSAPLAYSLPESGIILRLQSDLVLNPDGRPNDVYGTEPDVALPPAQRLPDCNKDAVLCDPWVQWVLQQ